MNIVIKATLTVLLLIYNNVHGAAEHYNMSALKEAEILLDADDSNTALELLQDPQLYENAKAQYMIGRILYIKDDPKAVDNLKHAADLGSVAAYNLLGSLYSAGWEEGGLEEDEQEAIYWWEKAIDAGNYDEYFRLYLTYEDREELNKEMALHEKALQSEETDTRAKAHLKLGRIFLKRSESAPEYNKALPHLRKAAALDNKFALADLGRLHWEGKGVQRDLDKALNYLMKANQLDDDRFWDGDIAYVKRLRYVESQGEKNQLDQMSDSKIFDRLVGLWRSDYRHNDFVTKGITEYRSNNTFSTAVSVEIDEEDNHHGATSGSWRVEHKNLILEAQGKSKKYPIVALTDHFLLYQGHSGIEVQETVAKATPEEKLLLGGPIELEDNTLKKRLVGQWHAQIEGLVTLDTVNEYRRDGIYVFKGTMKELSAEAEEISAKGTWRIENGLVVSEVTETSHPDILPTGLTTTDTILELTAERFTYKDDDSQVITEQRLK